MTTYGASRNCRPGSAGVLYRAGQLICDGNCTDEIVATFFQTDPATLFAGRGDSVSLVCLQPSGSGGKYQGRNETFWEHDGEALITWGYGAPKMYGKKAPCEVVGPPPIWRTRVLLEPKAMSIRFSLLTVALLLWLLGVFCVLAFRLIGSSINQDGFLHEPFALIPIGWLFIILGVIVGVLHVVREGARYVSGRHR